MYFASLHDLVTMGGHGFYVWLAFVFSIFCIAYLLLSPLAKQRRLLKTIYQQQQIEAGRHSLKQ